MVTALETKISKGDELSDFVLPYDEMPNDYLASDFFAYKTLEEKQSADYLFLLENINLRSKGNSKLWIYQNFKGPNKHYLDVYLLSQKNKIVPSLKHLNPKVGIIKKAYEPEVVKIPKIVDGKTMKVSIDYIKENNKKRVHAIHATMYKKGEELFELVNYLTE